MTNKNSGGSNTLLDSTRKYSLLFNILKFELNKETPVFPLGIAALRRRNPGEKMVAGSIPLKGHF